LTGSGVARERTLAWLREQGPWIALAVAGALVVAWVSLGSWQWNDYDAEARPALDALLGGHFTRFVDLAPAYGGSLLIRAPFAAIPKLWGGGELSVFRAAAAPCLAAAAVLGVWLAGRVRRRGVSPWAAALVLLLCVANPITFAALRIGHPEDLLGAVLCIAAVLFAMSQRPMIAGALLGLAIGNKAWAAVAIGPLLLALPDRRPRALLSCAVVAGAVLAPLALAGSSTSSFGSQAHGAANTGHLFNPWQWWWFLGTHGHPAIGSTGTVKIGYRAPPGWIGTIAHPLIVAITAPLTLACFWLRAHRPGQHRGQEPLLLLTLVLLLRAALDPWDNTYYVLPFLITLVAWEGLYCDRLPVLGLLAPLAAWFSIQGSSSLSLQFSPDLQAASFLLFSVPAAVAICAALLGPSASREVRGRRQLGIVPAG
jgi:Glycosyltransferase family 87